MNNNSKALNNSKLIIFGLMLVVAFSLFIWWKYIQSQQQSLTFERQRIGNALTQAGMAAAKVQRSLPRSTTVEDSLAPHELTDDAELAQAKLWQTLPKDKREIMLFETTQAGLAVNSNNQ